MNRTHSVNKVELIELLALETKVSKASAGHSLEALISIITNTLKRGDEVRIMGFGTFKTSNRKQPHNEPITTNKDENVTTGLIVRTPRFIAENTFKQKFTEPHA